MKRIWKLELYLILQISVFTHLECELLEETLWWVLCSFNYMVQNLKFPSNFATVTFYSFNSYLLFLILIPFFRSLLLLASILIFLFFWFSQKSAVLHWYLGILIYGTKPPTHIAHFEQYERNFNQSRSPYMSRYNPLIARVKLRLNWACCVCLNSYPSKSHKHNIWRLINWKFQEKKDNGLCLCCDKSGLGSFCKKKELSVLVVHEDIKKNLKHEIEELNDL